MKAPILALTVSALVAGAAGSAAAYPDHGYDRDSANQYSRSGYDRDSNREHSGWGHDRGRGYHWQRGERMGYNDWQNARRVDYRRYHLRQPPRGYEWRESNGSYVLAAVTTGVIASIIMNSNR